MKITDLLEILGAFLFVIGQVLLVTAAYQESKGLAITVAGIFVILNGILVTYAASVIDRGTKPRSDRP